MSNVHKSIVYVLFVALGLFQTQTFLYKTTPCYEFLSAANHCRKLILQFLSSTFTFIFPSSTKKPRAEVMLHLLIPEVLEDPSIE
jgi:hypothetical protein